MRNRIISVVALTALGTLPLVAPASAAPGAGAQPYAFRSCSTDGGIEQCYASRGVLKFSRTPSGNVHVLSNGVSSYRFTSDDFYASGTTRSNYTLLIKDGQERIVHVRTRWTDVFAGVTCTGTYRFMLQNGQLKHELIASSCDGPAR